MHKKDGTDRLNQFVISPYTFFSLKLHWGGTIPIFVCFLIAELLD